MLWHCSKWNGEECGEVDASAFPGQTVLCNGIIFAPRSRGHVFETWWDHTRVYSTVTVNLHYRPINVG